MGDDGGGVTSATFSRAVRLGNASVLVSLGIPDLLPRQDLLEGPLGLHAREGDHRVSGPQLGLAVHRLDRVVFADCRLAGADFTGARLADVDLRGADLQIERGVESLGGAVISPSQLVDLAPAFAAQIGVRVEAP